MDIQELNQKVSEYKNCLLFSLICILGILFFIYVGIVPTQKSLANLDKKIKDARLQVDIQKTLLPHYQSLNKQLKLKKAKALPFPEREKLPKGRTDEIYTILGEIAGKFNMETLSVVPDIKSLAKTHNLLLISAAFTGDFFDFRKFLIALGEMPYFVHIEMMEIQQLAEVKKLKINIWIAIS